MISVKFGAVDDTIFGKCFAAFVRSFSSFQTPIDVFKALVSSGKMQRNDHQLATAEALTHLFHQVQGYAPKKRSPPNGVYIYGTAGTGKTTLMDMFYDCCTSISRRRRVHFNEFMASVHADMFEVRESLQAAGRKSEDPCQIVATKIIQDSWLVCFDEFQVTDIADAMILKRLFSYLFDEGGVMVATSNRVPDDLYKNGPQRQNFVPFIQLLKSKCTLVQLESGLDFRREGGFQIADKGFYFVHSETDANGALDTLFDQLCTKEGSSVQPKTITHLGRDIYFQKTCGGILDTTFAELCDSPLAANDYLQIANVFHTVFMRDVPQLNIQMKSQTRRLIVLIDTLYDKQVRVVISAQAPLQNIFEGEKDDLKLDVQDEVFAIDRTISRLTEMQTKQYWRL